MRKQTLFSASFAAFAACFMFVSCSEEPSLDKYEVKIKTEQSVTVTYTGEEDCMWSSDNPDIATVDNGVITGVRVGETKVHANDLVCKVIVSPRYTKYYEPYANWAKGTKSAVSTYMSDYTLSSNYNDDTWLYLGTGSLLAYGYFFDNYDNLEFSLMMIDFSDASYLADFLAERYIPIYYEDDTFIFLSVDGMSSVALIVSSDYGGLVVMYMPYESSSVASRSDVDFASIKSKLEKISFVASSADKE